MRIKFAYSDIYDIYLYYQKHKFDKNYDFTKNIRKGKAFAAKMQKLYNKNRRVFDIMSKVSGLKWREKEIKVYVCNFLEWDFSDPVTIKVRKNMADAFETFVHEMSHQLIEFQNLGMGYWRKTNNWVGKKYSKEPSPIRRHILEHAILYKTYLEFYGKKRTMAIIKEYKDEGWKWHYEAWQIALKEGPDKIIKAYIK